MKQGQRRQIVVCPSCRTPKITLGENTFRCCGGLFTIKEHILKEVQTKAAPSVAERFEVQA